MKRISLYAFALVAVVALGACGGKKDGQIVNNSGAPDWVNRGSGAFKDEGGKQAIYGVGIVDNVRSISLAVETGDDRARANISKIMNSMVTSLAKSYEASVSAGDPSKVSEEQMVSQTSKVFSEFTLHGATPVNHWVDRSDPAHPVYYSLVKLDLGSIQGALDESKQLDSKVKEYVKANAEKAFDELNAEQAKHN
jgi:hypothetical protein